MENLGLGGMRPDPDFWRGKRVLLTGQTGFKGSWAALWLSAMGAKVSGLALAPESKAGLFERAGVAGDITHDIADLRDPAAVRAVVAAAQPEIVLHLAAQALVRRSYREPALTFDTNVMGTAHLLDALAEARHLKAVLIITSDKVYANNESGRAFREDDALGGHDPYSASKAAVELLVAAYRAARFEARGVPLASARGGNVIGGGDDSEDRIVPDIVRAAQSGEPLMLRHPSATRPWQHVLDCLAGYFVFAEMLASRDGAPRCLNIGPDPAAPISVAMLVEAISPALGVKTAWILEPGAHNAPREMKTLALDPARARALGIIDCLPGRLALEWTAQWYAAAMCGENMRAFTLAQINAYTAMTRPD